MIGVVPSMAVQLFPPAVRFSGLSFAYNVAYAVFGGLTPVLVSLLLRFDTLAPAHYVVALSVVGVGMGRISAAARAGYQIGRLYATMRAPKRARECAE